MMMTKTTVQQLTYLFLKLFIAILFVVNLAFVVTSVTFIYQNAQQQADEMIESVQDNIKERAEDDHEGKIKWNTLLDAYIARQDDDAVKIVTPKDRTFYSDDGEELFDKIDQSKNYHNVIFASHSVYYVEKVTVDDYQVSVALNVDGLFDLVIRLLITMIVLNLLAILLCIPLIKRFARKWSQPLEKMDDEITAIQKNQVAQKRITVPQQPREIKNLAQTFNKLLDYQSKAMEREKQFVIDASHELKTPIAALRGHINLIKRRRKTNPEVVEKSLKYIDSESLRMQKLVNELLEIGRSQQLNSSVKPVNLVSLVKQESKVIEEEFGRKVTLNIPQNLFYKIDPKDFQYCIHNLLENAAKYSPLNSPIILEMFFKDKKVVLKVKDQGRGIHKENYDKVFDRFYREDESHSSKIPGTGLGLSIVKGIVEKYHGQVKISENKPKGTIFTVIF